MDFWSSVCSSQEAAQSLARLPSLQQPQLVPGEHPAVISSRKESSPFAVEKLAHEAGALAQIKWLLRGGSKSLPTTVTAGFL